MPRLLWTFILLAILLPLHILVIGPAVDGLAVGVRLVVAIGYLAIGMLWPVAGDRLGIVRR